MKKIFISLYISIITITGFAQVQRETNSSQNTVTNSDKKNQKLEMMRSLNLSKDQKGQLKEARKNMKQQKDAINADSSLSPEQKQKRLKELHKEQNQKLNTILTPEQNEKLREEKRNQKTKNGMMDIKDSTQ